MLMADADTALRETRRVLRPGGATALAVWDAVEHNPWALLPATELRERGLTPPPEPDAPGPFALGSDQRVGELLERSGFSEVRVEALELVRSHPSFEDLWESTLDLSRVFHDAVLEQSQAEIEEIKGSLVERFSPYTHADGALQIPGRTLLASASA
jgi:hypothetical protein